MRKVLFNIFILLSTITFVIVLIFVYQNSEKNNKNIVVDDYPNESYQSIELGFLKINLKYYHLVTKISTRDEETFTCKLNTGEHQQKDKITIKVSRINEKILTSKQALEYLKLVDGEFIDYKFFDVDDSSGVKKMMVISQEINKYSYIVCYESGCYLIISDYNGIENFIFNEHQKPSQRAYSQTLKKNNSFQSIAKTVLSYNPDVVEYQVSYGSNKIINNGTLIRNSSGALEFILIDEDDNKLLELLTYASDLNEVITFVDANVDGYFDILFLKESGTRNNNHAIYLWNHLEGLYDKVEYGDILSNLEFHGDYILNYIKDDNGGYIEQKLELEGNKLIRITDAK